MSTVMARAESSQSALTAETAFKDFNADSAIVVLAKMVATGIPKESIDQMKQLVEWNDARRARAEFDAAFSLARGEFKEAKKSGFNTGTQKSYSLLEDYDEATRESLSKHGLSWRHIPQNVEGGKIGITCVLAHKGGYRDTAYLEADPKTVKNNMSNDLQSVGIVSTYLKRLTLCAMLGLVSDSEFDNDGQGEPEKKKPTSPKAGQQGQQPAGKKPEKPPYPKADFDTNFPKWKDLIASGKKKPKDILVTLESKYTLDNDQHSKINNLGEQQ